MVTLPDTRGELGEHLQDLANPLFQWRAWVGGEQPYPGQYEAFRYSFKFLFDSSIGDNVEAAIGAVLLTQEEATTIKKLKEVLLTVMSAVEDAEGVNPEQLTDRDYITHPLWVNVIEVAREALDAFTYAEYGYPLRP